MIVNCLTNNVSDMNIENFGTYLRQGNMAENTIAAYLYAVKEYYSRHKELNKRNLLVYKTYLIEKFKPKTVNLRIQAMNKYLVPSPSKSSQVLWDHDRSSVRLQ